MSTAMIFARTGQPGAGDRRVADAAAAEHRHGVAAAHAAGVDRRTDAGHDAAAEQAGGGRRGRRVDLRALAGVDQRLLRERADAEGRGQLGAVGQRHLLRGVVRVEAVPGLALGAGAALPAHRAPVEDHVVADRDVGDALAHGGDDAGGLVAEQEREVVVDAALAVVQVGVADPAGLHVDDRLTGPGIGHHDRLDRDRRTLAAGDDALHLVGHAASLGRATDSDRPAFRLVDVPGSPGHVPVSMRDFGAPIPAPGRTVRSGRVLLHRARPGCERPFHRSRRSSVAVPSFLARERIVARPGFNRWLIPPAALAVHLCIGQVYATSVYKAALVKHFDTSLTAIGIIFSIAIVMLGLSAAVFGTWVDRNGPRAAMFTAACFWSAGFLVGSLGIATEPAVAGLPGLRRHRRHRPGHRLHLAGLHADQVVPRPPGPGHRHGDHGLRRRRADRLTAVPAADEPATTRPTTRRTRRRCRAAAPSRCCSSPWAWSTWSS